MVGTIKRISLSKPPSQRSAPPPPSRPSRTPVPSWQHTQNVDQLLSNLLQPLTRCRASVDSFSPDGLLGLVLKLKADGAVYPSPGSP
jgi:hypothetical protein